MNLNRYVDDLDSVDDLERYTPPPFMCMVEHSKAGKTGEVSVGMITICPSTGDVVWDDFEDTLMRIELEVIGSIRTGGVFNKRILDKTCSHKTSRTAFTQGRPVGTNCEDVGTLHWVSIQLLGSSTELTAISGLPLKATRSELNISPHLCLMRMPSR
jgi:hypothetical protein